MLPRETRALLRELRQELRDIDFAIATFERLAALRHGNPGSQEQPRNGAAANRREKTAKGRGRPRKQPPGG